VPHSNAICSIVPAGIRRRPEWLSSDFIEDWYNPRRRHSALGYKSPMNYEKAAEAAA
jgi:transposase InsO family protein